MPIKKELFFSEYQAFWEDIKAKEKLERDLQDLAEKIKTLQLARVCSVTTRIKSADSLLEKTERENNKSRKTAASSGQPYTSLSPFQMEDLLGGRITVLNICDAQPVKEITIKGLEEVGWTYLSKKEKDHFTKPTKGGHRAFHVYFKKVFKKKIVTAEIQILTEPASFWTQWEHFLSYKGINVADPTRIEEQTFKTINKRLEVIDFEANELRLELSYFRPAYPKKILGKKPENAFFAFAESSAVRKPALSKIKKIVPGIEWLALPQTEYENGHYGFSARNTLLGFDPTGNVGSVSDEKNGEFSDKYSAEIFKSKSLGEKAEKVLKRICEVKRKSLKLFNGPTARLEAYASDGDTLSLWLQETSYYAGLLTNALLSEGNYLDLTDEELEPISSEISYLKAEMLKHAHAFLNVNPKALPQELANNLAVHVTLKTRDEKLVVTKRADLAMESHRWSSSASGDLYPRSWTATKRGDLLPLNKKDKNTLYKESIYGEEETSYQHVISPFLGASRELAEELGVYVPIEKFFVQALVRSHEFHQPLLLFEAKTDLTFDELINASPIASDRWEIGEIAPLPASREGLKQLMSGFSEVVKINGQKREVDIPGIKTDVMRSHWQEKAIAGILLALSSEIWK